MNAGKNLKSGSLNVTLGFGAGGNLDADLSENGKVQTEPALAGTYSQTGTTITVTATASGVVAGNKVGIRFTSGDLSATGDMQWMNVASKADANTFRSEEHTSELQSLMRISYAVFCLHKK